MEWEYRENELRQQEIIAIELNANEIDEEEEMYNDGDRYWNGYNRSARLPTWDTMAGGEYGIEE